MPESNPSVVSAYLTSLSPSEVDPGALAYYASLDVVGRQSPSVAASIIRELRSQRSNIKLIASENYDQHSPPSWRTGTC